MKFKHLFLTVSVMALFSSCSNDELVSETTSHGDAIAFSVTTTNATRAADYWCNNQLPTYFQVSTGFDGKIYFDGETYKKGTGNTYLQEDGNYRYWPAISTEKPISVYAYKVKDDASANGTAFATFAWDNAANAPTITYDMSSRKNASDQYDLLYAYTKETTKPAYNTTVALNFRHALSQIVFYAKCSNSKICVEIEDIALVNAAKSGVFTLPTDNNVTNENLNDHTQATAAKIGGLGTWALTYDGTTTTTGEGDSQTSTFKQNNAYYAYTADCKVKKTVGETETYVAVVLPSNAGDGEDSWTNLTDNKNDEAGTHSEYGKSLLVLPQTKYTGEGAADNSVKAYKPASGALSTVGGACIAIKCRIRNIAGAAVADNDVYLWGSAPTENNTGAAYLVVPVDFAWEQGKKYIYRINFSKTGHGGYNPEDGKEVLIPIQLSVTVDDFAKVDDTNLSQDI